MTYPQPVLTVPRVEAYRQPTDRSRRMPLSQPTIDRPGWIPAHIRTDWDDNPYAYQTEEELMPAGGEHGRLLGYLMELFRHTLQQRDLMLLMDTFMLYRDTQGVRQRIAPDLLLMPYEPTAPSAYDLDHRPPPQCVVEVTSPSSRMNDLQNKVSFYLGLGIPTYLVIDAIRSDGRSREQIELHLWRLVNGQAVKMTADGAGRYHLPEMGLTIKAEYNRLMVNDAFTGETLFDVSQLVQALDEERELKQREIQRLTIARLKAEEVQRKAEEAHRKAEEARHKAELESQQAKRLLVQTLLAEGYPPAKIATLTGLSLIEIEHLRNTQ